MPAILEVYRDVVTNGLDLVSFIFVTPAILRRSKPLFGEITVILVGVSLVLISLTLSGLFIGMSITWLGPSVTKLFTANLFTILGGIVILLIVGTAVAIAPMGLFLQWWEDRSDAMVRRFSQMALVFGIVLFFLSRLIGLGASIYLLIV